MNIESMRARFLEIVSENADAIDEAQIDAYFNRAYQFGIPAAIDGELSETTWTVTTADGTESYAYPGYIVAPKVHAWLNDSGGSIPLTVMSNPVLFEHRFGNPSDAEGQPVAILLYGRSAKIYPIPDAIYTIDIPSRGGAATALTSGAVIDNDVHAMAVVYAAAVEFCDEIDDTEGAQKAGLGLAAKLTLLQTISSARPRGRTPARSF